MECEPFLPFSRESWLGDQNCLKERFSAAIKDVHLIVYSIGFHMLDMQYPWDICSPTAMVCFSFEVLTLTTPVAATDYPLFPSWQTNTQAVFFAQHRKLFNPGHLVGSHSIPKVLCQTCKTCIKISQPYIGHLRWKQINSPNVNWLYSPNIKHKTTWEI